MTRSYRSVQLFALAALLLAGPSFAATEIVIVNTNAAGVGFNDPRRRRRSAATPAPRSASSGSSPSSMPPTSGAPFWTAR